MVKNHFLSLFIFILYRALMFTWRVRIEEHPETQKLIQGKQPIILAHWHGDELALLHIVSKYNIATMVSTSKDGELMNSLIKRLGGQTSRGSSTRGGVRALKGLIKLLRSGNMTSVAVDGPKGPIFKVKPGIFELSRLANGYIVPLAACSTSSISFEKAWNKTFLPKPFAKIVVVLGKPHNPIEKKEDTKSIKLGESLGQDITDTKHQASKIIATI